MASTKASAGGGRPRSGVFGDRAYGSGALTCTRTVEQPAELRTRAHAHGLRWLAVACLCTPTVTHANKELEQLGSASGKAQRLVLLRSRPGTGRLLWGWRVGVGGSSFCRDTLQLAQRWREDRKTPNWFLLPYEGTLFPSPCYLSCSTFHCATLSTSSSHFLRTFA